MLYVLISDACRGCDSTGHGEHLLLVYDVEFVSQSQLMLPCQVLYLMEVLWRKHFMQSMRSWCQLRRRSST